MEAIEIQHIPEAGLFEARTGKDRAQLQYRTEPGKIVFLHTEVPPAFRHHGVAEQLAHAGLEFARDSKLAVVAICPYVAAYIRKHPEYQPLVDKSGET
jgi:predicted GNAT family acetyltransferase